MLSRVAESLYWIGRYLDRGENTARLINSTTQVLLDLPAKASFGWHILIKVAGLDAEFVKRYPQADEDTIIRFLVDDEDNPSSIISSIHNARENARTVREVLPMELWERINSLYLYIRDNGPRALVGRGPREEVLRGVIGRRESITGLFTGSMSRDAAYQFIKLGRNIERADMTTRIVDVNSALQVSGDSAIAALTTQRAWVATLNALSALQMYRNHVGVHVRRRYAAEFLLKDTLFPRSVNFCFSEIQACLAALPDNPAAIRALRQAEDHLTGMRLEGLTSPVLHDFLDDLQGDIATIHAAVAGQYFNQHQPKNGQSAGQ
ncbi:MAG: alpha-E domain-containing protein [Gammaproteobacteria bacterium]|nr:alpha-E domain-containing protein [Gammaproteobacteria bacterium]MBU1646564.1 alpha-E domain-containing protein [Gammaproteobacteria bacterium]MBU1972821.1 alpha-E domain-containing protein [Gammaproteobacteria bacterium]